MRHARQVEEPVHHPEKPPVQRRRQEQDQQKHQSELLGRRQGALRLGSQVRLQGRIAVQTRDG
ncbi:Uncharacterised protein [Mycobacterium tuberculosis]|uniref:Uncharacterized protein n=1 Tax=Mycobacterium tuberculosis TaxID=1773 RepID=A0A0U0QYM6_MYCTX|nr:Uncharacterised protein [Mycobacterium tuberculosis]